MTSSVTRLIIHFTKLGGQAGPCPTIPEAILEECKAKYLPLKTRKGVARASEEVVAPDCDLSDSGDDDLVLRHLSVEVNVDECKLSVETLKSLNSAVRGRGRASTRAPTTYVRRGSGSGSSTTATTLENVPLSRSTEPREPEFDDEGNILSEGDYGLSSTHSDPPSDEDDTHQDSDWETDTST
ncbi:hypothetical protein L7F22_044823 [Adiantum nelumboides]|nr:hypothetical protein [Adiantum nelumboides]